MVSRLLSAPCVSQLCWRLYFCHCLPLTLTMPWGQSEWAGAYRDSGASWACFSPLCRHWQATQWRHEVFAYTDWLILHKFRLEEEEGPGSEPHLPDFHHYLPTSCYHCYYLLSFQVQGLWNPSSLSFKCQQAQAPGQFTDSCQVSCSFFIAPAFNWVL